VLPAAKVNQEMHVVAEKMLPRLCSHLGAWQQLVRQRCFASVDNNHHAKELS
jgi:hypothetical protein